MARLKDLAQNTQEQGQGQQTQGNRSPSVALCVVYHATNLHAGALGFQGAN